MKTRRIRGADIQAALREVRRTLGPDAVIMSTRETDDGIEIVAAAPVTPAAPRPVRTAGEGAAGDARVMAPAPRAKAPARERVAAVVTAPRAGLASLAAGIARPIPTPAPAMPRPAARAMRLLERLGLSGDVRTGIRAVLEAAGPRATPALLRSALADRIEVEGPELMHRGGRVAVVGGTGVGKTTTIAKLAAHFARRHGPNDVALVNADQFRIGASDQLRRFGQLLGVPTYGVQNAAQLKQTLSRLARVRLVLVDTAGIAHGDVRFDEQLRLLAACELDCYLALSLNTQTAALARSVQAFAALHPRACILTKDDEALTLGGGLSMALRHDLPLAYVTNGPGVPADIRLAKAERLAFRAMELAGQESRHDSRLAGAAATEVAR